MANILDENRSKVSKIFEIAYNIKRIRKERDVKMNKRSLLPVLSTALLAPAFLAGQVYAEETANSCREVHPVASNSSYLGNNRGGNPAVPNLNQAVDLQRKLLLNLPKAKKRTPLSYTPMMSMVVL